MMTFFPIKRSILPLAFAVFTLLFSACNSDGPQVKQQIATAPSKPVLMEPFRYHKTIEVSPGNVFDIFSWGRGATETGSLLILSSDTAAKKFVTTTGDLEGAITDVYNTDMDMDGNPEILVQAKAKDTTVHTQIYAFEYQGDKAHKLDFPKLNSAQKKGYRGEDNFYIKEGILMREFPIYDGNGAGAKPTGEKRLLQYGLRNNSFTVKTISSDDESKSKSSIADSVKKTTPVANVTRKKTVEKSTPKKKHSMKKKKPKSSKKTKKHHHRR